MSATITGEQRDALYKQLMDRLAGINDIPAAINARNFGIAERIGRDYADELHLLFYDLGVDELGVGDLVELNSPPELLRRVLPRLARAATETADSLEAETVEIGEMRWRGELISDACATVLGTLGEASLATDTPAPGKAPRMGRWRRILPRAR